MVSRTILRLQWPSWSPNHQPVTYCQDLQPRQPRGLPAHRGAVQVVRGLTRQMCLQLFCYSGTSLSSSADQAHLLDFSVHPALL